MSSTSTERAFRIISVTDVAPLSPPDQYPIHRRVVSGISDPDALIDVGYNEFRAGLSSERPYAYDRDEVCYFPKGEFHLHSQGVESSAKVGEVMWRPTGASTDRISIPVAGVSICAFSPARRDMDRHRLPPEEIGRWSGSAADRPTVAFYSTRLENPEFGGSEGVFIHRILSPEKTPRAAMTFTVTEYATGAQERTSVVDQDRVFYLEFGRLRWESEGRQFIQTAGEFAYCPAQTPVDSLEACDTARLIMWASVIAKASKSESAQKPDA